ncbi:UNVERIFIED_CONTAM: hypothetical protein PYX00_009167 [Menopon gallinae]
MKHFASILSIIVLGIATSVGQNEPTLAESMLQFFVKDIRTQFLGEPKDERNIQKEYDFIIVGAGSAGCVVTNRLSEVKEWSVLLIEAGGPENVIMDIPAVVNYLQFSSANWKYKTEPSSSYCLGMENNRCHWPRGRVMGGSSVLNYMIYTRGNRRDYDNWEKMGNEGWGWKDVLPYFRKLEEHHSSNIAANKLEESKKGYMSVTDVPYKTPVGHAFVESGLLMGYPSLNYDMPYLRGFNHLIVSMKDGLRWSSSKAYLHSVKNRTNLHVKKNAVVTKILIDPKTKVAVGVEFISNSVKYVVRARKEVIISGGAINSPQLLMLSGIGPRKHLMKNNINVLQKSKVGYNLQDHYLAGGLTFLLKDKSTFHSEKIFQTKKHLTDYLMNHTGMLSSPGGCEAVAFINVDSTKKEESPNMELLFVLGALNSDRTLSKSFNLNDTLYKEMYEPILKIDSVSVFPILLAPKSRGRILLRDSNPLHHPLIYPNYFSDSEGYDMRSIIAGVRKVNEVMDMPPFKKFGMKPYSKPLPPCKNHVYDSDKYWECYSRHMTFTLYHPAGTCKMGPDNDPTAVVDPRLRVRGIKRLRVIDASIMPVITRAHTNAPTYMIAEKGSDMIKEDWGINIK